MKLQTKLILTYLACGLAPLAIASIANYHLASSGVADVAAKADLEARVTESLVAQRALKEAQLNHSFRTMRAHVVTFSNNRLTIDALRDFRQAFAEYREACRLNDEKVAQMKSELAGYYNGSFAEEYRKKNEDRQVNTSATLGKLDENALALQHAYIKSNPNPLGSKHLLDRADGAARYHELHERFHPSTRDFVKEFGYCDVFLIDADTGDVVYSVFKEVDFATSLLDGPYADTNLAKAFRRAKEASSPDECVFADYQQYTPSYEEPSSFLASPVFDDGKLIGVAVFQVPVELVCEFMAHRAGLGETGETILVGPDYLMRSNSRLEPENHSVSGSFRNPDKGKVKTDATIAAIESGETGTSIVTDYRGVETLISYGPVDILGTPWCLNAKMDTSEAYRELNEVKATAGTARSQIIWWSLGLIVVAGIVVAGVAWLVCRLVLPAVSAAAENQSKQKAIDRAQAAIEFNLDGTILTANENFLATVGYTLDEIQGQHHRMFVEPEFARSAEYAAFWEKLGRGDFEAAEYKRLGKDGKEIWIQASYNPILDLNGKPVKVVKYATDVTEQKLRNADYKGQIAAVGKAQAVIEFNLDGTILTANENFLATVGYTLDEIQGQHHRMFVEPEFARSAEYAAFWEKLGRGDFEAAEYKRLGKDGKEIWIQASYNPILDLNGKPVKVVKYATDVTEQKLRNADYKGQIAAVGKAQAVIEFNLDGTILTANENFLATVGYTLDEIQGQHHRMFVEPEFARSAEYAAFWEKLGRGEFEAAEYKRLGKDGKEIWIQASYNPILDLNGKPFKVVKFATDVTGQKVADRIAAQRADKIAAFQQHEVEQFGGVMNQIAAGDLTQRYEAAAGDEDTAEVAATFSNIAGSVNSMCANLREVIGGMAANAGHLASSSTELSATATQLAGGAEETTGQSATVAAASEEMSLNMKNMSTSTEQVTTNVKTVATAVDELTSSIGEIAKTAEQASTIAEKASQLTKSSNETVSELGTAAEEIGKVIEVIQDIAEQTNLLALNATIEAARAGEAGKGFAVVATEVKELARQTAGATEDIRDRIQRIQGSTGEAVRSIGEVGEVIQQVNDASTTIASAVEEQSIITKDIAGNINETAETVTSVASGVGESATACDEVARNIAGVDTAAKQTASGAAQLQTVGTELSQLAEQLQGMVGRFKFAEQSALQPAESEAQPADLASAV